jgi:predicted TPR repeat methyltransferase
MNQERNPVPPPSEQVSEEPVQVTVDQALAMAMDLHKQSQLDRAAYIYRTILSAVPEHVEALNFLGVLCQQLGDIEEGVTLIERAVALRPDYVDAQSNLGNMLRIQGQLAEAETAYRRAIELAPKHAQAHNNLGVVLRNQGRLPEAEAVLRRALELRPEWGDAHFNLGNVLDQGRRQDEAIVAYQSAIKYAPELLDAHDALGRMLGRKGRTKEAIRVYQTLLERKPDDPTARHMIAALSGEAVPSRATDEYVSETFDRFADSFDFVLKGLEYRAPHLVAQAVREIHAAAEGPLDILDAGCGTGLCGPLVRPFARRLVGIDLSARMLARCRPRQVYDTLLRVEITEYLRQHRVGFDVIISADTLVYFGDLDEVLRAARASLRAGGYLVFTLEDGKDRVAETGYALQPHGRYCHADSYVLGVLRQVGFSEHQVAREVLRLEGGAPVPGLMVRAGV